MNYITHIVNTLRNSFDVLRFILDIHATFDLHAKHDCNLILPNQWKFNKVARWCTYKLPQSFFHKLRFKNKWINTTNKETIFITCDEDKESTPGKTDLKANYMDFIPKSIIIHNQIQGYWTNKWKKKPNGGSPCKEKRHEWPQSHGKLEQTTRIATQA